MSDYSTIPSELPCPDCGGPVGYQRDYRGKILYGTCSATGLLLAPLWVDGCWMGRYWSEGREGESFAAFVDRRAPELRENHGNH